jgi:hypothetical protein
MLPLQLQVVFLLVPWHFLQVLAPCWTVMVMVTRSVFLCSKARRARGKISTKKEWDNEGVGPQLKYDMRLLPAGKRHSAAGGPSQGFRGNICSYMGVQPMTTSFQAESAAVWHPELGAHPHLSCYGTSPKSTRANLTQHKQVRRKNIDFAPRLACTFA